MQEPLENSNHTSLGKLDAVTELELFFPKEPLPKFVGDCKGLPTEWWFPEHARAHNETFSRARQICKTCPASEECLEFSLRSPNLHGMWAGLTPKQRQSERCRRRRVSQIGKAK